jgi:transglutaminase-like putative cysteine protease
VVLCHNEAHLTPRSSPTQRCLNGRIKVEPAPSDSAQREDFFGNPVFFFAVQHPHKQLCVKAISEVEVYPGLRHGPNRLPPNSSPWEQVRECLRTDLSPETLEARQFVLDSPFASASADLLNYVRPSFDPRRPLVEAVQHLMQRIHAEFTYDSGFSTVATPLSEVLHHRRGVCQDFAQFAIGCLRAQGLAARYVSGYLETSPPPGQQRLVGADASHAWFSVFEPELGWLDFDPTNNQIPMERHITTAWGRDYTDITPLKGVIFGGGLSELSEVSVDIENLGP